MYTYNAFDEMNSQNFLMWISSISYYNLRQDLARAREKAKQIQGKTNKLHTVLLQCRLAEGEEKLSRDAEKHAVQHPEIPYKRAQCSSL